MNGEKLDRLLTAYARALPDPVPDPAAVARVVALATAEAQCRPADHRGVWGRIEEALGLQLSPLALGAPAAGLAACLAIGLALGSTGLWVGQPDPIALAELPFGTDGWLDDAGQWDQL